MKIQNRTFKTAVALVMIITVFLVAGCGGAEQRKAKYLARGKDYLSQQNYEKAVIELKNALQIDPKYSEAYLSLGEAEEGLRDYQQAFALYNKAIELNPDQLKARIHLGEFYLLSGNVAKANEQIDAVLAKDPKNARALLVRAAITAKEGNEEEAIKQASDITKIAPSEFEAYNLIASIYAKQKKLDKSGEILQQGLTANPKSIPLRLSLAQIYTMKRENDKAEKILQECISIDPSNLQYQMNLAKFLTATNQLDKAEKVLRTAIEQKPEDDQRRLILVQFLGTARKDMNAAEQELLGAIKQIPDSSRLRFNLASLYEQKDDIAKAMDVYQDIISRYGEKPEGLGARNQLAALLQRQGKQDEAEKLTDEVLKENPKDGNALMAKARFLLGRHDAPGAIAALRTVLQDQPNLVDAYLYLADAHMLNKDPALAKDSLMKAVELNPGNIKARLALAQYYARTGDISSASKTVDEALKQFPNDYQALTAKSQLLFAKKDISGAQQVLEKIKSTYPDNPAGYYQLGQLYMSQQKYEASAREFEQALLKFKGNYQFMAGEVSAYLAQKKPDKAISRLNAELANEPSSRPFAHELLAEVYLTQKKYDEAEKALYKAIEMNPTWALPYRNLASLYRVKGDTSSVEKTYQQGLKATSDDPQLLLDMAGWYEQTNNYEQAIAAYERILNKQPSNDVAANNLAALLLDHKTDSNSLKRAKELTSRFESSEQPAFLDTLGWMYYRSGELDKAIDVMGKVVKLAPAVGVFHYHLGMAYYKKGDHASAKTQLSKALETKNNFAGIEDARTTLKQIQ